MYIIQYIRIPMSIYVYICMNIPILMFNLHMKTSFSPCFGLLRLHIFHGSRLAGYDADFDIEKQHRPVEMMCKNL